jgi:hypothetical protein
MDAIILDRVKKWLQEEISDNQDVVDAKDDHEDCITSDGTDDIIYGRHECAEGLLEQIDLWEEELNKEIEARTKLNLN